MSSQLTNPNLVVDYFVNILEAHAVLMSKVNGFYGWIRCANCIHDWPSKFRHSVLVAFCTSSFLLGISAIFSLSPDPQVRRVDASRIIPARAVVANNLALRNWTIMKNPTEDGSLNPAAMLPATTQLSVACPVNGFSPQPAGIGLANVGPKAEIYRKRGNSALARDGVEVKLNLLSIHSMLGHAPGLDIAGAFSFYPSG